MDDIDEDLKKKIESTKFVYIVAQSGVGKSFNDDYLETIRGWKHIDGDIPVKEQAFNSEYKNATDQLQIRGDYTDKAQNEGWKVCAKILGRLTLEAARDSDTVVLTHWSPSLLMRTSLRQHLINAGAKDVSTVFLHCDFDVQMQALWKRYNRLAEQANTTVEVLYNLFGATGIVDFDSFVEFFKNGIFGFFQEPDESEQPYKKVDATAKDVTGRDSLDEALGIENKSRWDLAYEEMVQNIKAIDVKRDQAFMDSLFKTVEDSETSEAEEEMPQKRTSIAGRSSFKPARSRQAQFNSPPVFANPEQHVQHACVCLEDSCLSC